MVEYERQIGKGAKTTNIRGTRCDRCGFTSLYDDEDVWSAVGL